MKKVLVLLLFAFSFTALASSPTYFVQDDYVDVYVDNDVGSEKIATVNLILEKLTIHSESYVVRIQKVNFKSNYSIAIITKIQDCDYLYMSRTIPVKDKLEIVHSWRFKHDNIFKPIENGSSGGLAA